MLTQNLNVRADKKSVVPVVHMVQGDSGRRLTCIVQDYDIPSGSSASLSVERPDGNVYIASATISNNNVSAMITSTMIEVVGIVKGTMRITSSGSVVSTFEFVIKVEEAAGSGIEPSPADGNVYVYINGEKVKVVTDPDLEAVKSELSESIVEIKNDLYSENETVFSGEYTSTNGNFFGNTSIIDCDIAQGVLVKLKFIFTPDISSQFTVYLRDSSNAEVGRVNKVPSNTEVTYTTTANVTHICVYLTGAQPNTKVVGTARVSSENPNSFEARLEDVEESAEKIGEVEQSVITLDNEVNGTINYIKGKKLNSDGTLSDNPNFKTSDFINTSDLHNKVVRFYYGDVSESVSLVHYDANKNRIGATAYTAGQEYRAFTLGNSDFVRFSYSKDYKGKFVVGTSSPFTTVWEENRESGIVALIRKRIDIKATDDAETFVTKMIEAFTTKNCDVHFERAVYDISSEIPYIITKYGMAHNETPIGNGCRYFFNGATVIGRYDLDTLGIDFYGNLLGCQRVPSSFELYDGILIATDTRYVVHDESTSMDETFKHIYHNMVLEYRTEKRQEDIRKCLGGGTGASGVIDIECCKFITDGTDSCASFHGNAYDVVGAEFNINIRNSWFSNNFRAGALAEHQTARLFYTGNSAQMAPRRYDGWDVTEFLNEIRTS